MVLGFAIIRSRAQVSRLANQFAADFSHQFPATLAGSGDRAGGRMDAFKGLVPVLQEGGREGTTSAFPGIIRCPY